jgi:outer membrane protein TolC
MKSKFYKRFKVEKKYLFLGMIIFLWLLSLSYFSHAQEGIRQISLEESYALALITHEKIMIAEREVAKSKLLPKKATTVLMPRISVNGGYSRLDEPIEFERGIGGFPLPPVEVIPEDQWIGNFQFNQPIYEGRFFPLRRQAFQAIDGSTESYYQIKQEILFRVAQAYYEFLKAEALVENAKEILDLIREELRVSRVKYKAGDVTEDVVIGSELNVTRAQSKLIKSVNHFKLARDVLKTLIGLDTRHFDVIKPAKLPESTESFEELIDKAFQNRPDYKRAVLDVNLAQTEIDLVKAEFHPKLKGSWDYYVTDDPAFDQDDNYWVATVKLEIPILEGGLRFLNLKEKRESLRQVRFALDDLKNTIQIEVEDAMLTMQTDKSILANLTKQVELAEKNYEIIFAKFKYGSATSVELNDATGDLDTARTELITKTFDYQIALLSLEKVSGTFASDLITGNEQKQ